MTDSTLTNEPRAPSSYEAAFICPHCHAFTQQTWFSLFGRRSKDPPGTVDAESIRKIAAGIDDRAAKADDPEVERERAQVFRTWATAVERGDPFLAPSESSPYVRPARNLSMSICFVCQREALWINGRLTYPTFSPDAPQPNDDLNVDIRRDYEEAATVLSQSPRSSCALLRLSIQKLCEQSLERTGDINEMIGELVGRGLSPVVQQALDVVRVVGNEAVHPGTLDLRDDADTARRLFGLVNLIAEVLITQPRHVAELYATLPPNKLQGIEVRNTKALSAPGTNEPRHTVSDEVP